MALKRDGLLKLHQSQFKNDLRPIDENCDCSTCKHYTRAYLSYVVRFESVGASLLTVHNVAYQVDAFRKCLLAKSMWINDSINIF